MRTEFRLYQASEWETGRRNYYPLLDPVADRQIDEWTMNKLRSDARKVFVNFGPLQDRSVREGQLLRGGCLAAHILGSGRGFWQGYDLLADQDLVSYRQHCGPHTRDWGESLKLESR